MLSRMKRRPSSDLELNNLSHMHVAAFKYKTTSQINFTIIRYFFNRSIMEEIESSRKI